MEGELATLMEVFHRVKEAGGSAKLTLLTRGGKVNAKLDLELGEGLPSSSLPTSTAADSTSPLPTSPTALRPASGQRKRSKAARRKAKARAAAHQASLASRPDASSSPTAQPTAPASGAPQRRPLCLLPSPPDGRRRVMSVGRREMPSISLLNLDGAHPPLPPPLHPPEPSPTYLSQPTSTTSAWTEADREEFRKLDEQEQIKQICDFLKTQSELKL